MKKYLAFLLCCPALYAAYLSAAEEPLLSPHWFFEFKGGRFHPALPDWDQYYGSDAMNQYFVALGYMPRQILEFGGEVGHSHDHGQGTLPSSGSLGGEVKYNLTPVHVYLTLLGKFSERQWLIPYIGGGLTYLYYKQEVVDQQENKGHANGWNARAGLRLLLNQLDPDSAHNIMNNYKIQHTYLTLEAQKFSAKADDTDLGGVSYLLGIRFEY